MASLDMQNLAEENAKLRALVQKATSLPISPPATEKALSEPSSPLLSPVGSIFDNVAQPDPLTALNLDVSNLVTDKSSPLYAVVQMMKAQMAAQAAVQDKLLSQLGELRCSHANLQANTCDVNDELMVMRDKAALLANEVNIERQKREAIEKEKEAEAEKVATLRQKMDESKRAIMRLQEEAASKRNSDSRRGSIGFTPSSHTPERRGSVASVTGRRASLLNGMDVPSMQNRRPSTASTVFGNDLARRSSLDIRRSSASTIASPASVGLGLQMEDGVVPTTPVSRRASVVSTGHRSRTSFSLNNNEEDPKSSIRNLSLSNAVSESAIDEDFSPLVARRHSRKPSLANLSIDEEGDGSLQSLSARPVLRSTVRSSMDAGVARNGSLLNRPMGAGRASLPDLGLDNSSSAVAELALLKAQLATTQNRLAEAQEAKVASDTCLQALKEYIAKPLNSPSSSAAIKLPPLPTDDTANDFDDETPLEKPGRRTSVWRFPIFSAAPTKAESVSPERRESRPTAPPAAVQSATQEISPVLTQFNGWSVRRRASAAALKEKSSKQSLKEPEPEASLSPKFEASASPFGSFSFNQAPAKNQSSTSDGEDLSPGGTTSWSDSGNSPATWAERDVLTPRMAGMAL